MRKKWFRIVFRQRVFVILLLLLQVVLMTLTVYSSSRTYRWIHYALYLISALVILHVISTGKKSSYKLIWAVTILIFPLFGGLLYLFVYLQTISPEFKKNYQAAEQRMKAFLKSNEDSYHLLEKTVPEQAHQAFYLTKSCGFSAFENSEAEYLTPGEEKFLRLKEILSVAKDFIFLEYFIVSEGAMWTQILEILKQKAAAGVDVRLIYDDLGCFMKLPADYQKKLESLGIKCRVFNKFRPALSTLQNNRDHRKIAVVDGKWAITGGINIGDEYINKTSPLGHWKDASILICGEAANGFTAMFLTMWQTLTGETEEISAFLNKPQEEPPQHDGFVIPYSDCPMDSEYTGEQVYMNMINGAKHYLYIQTPYLIIDDSMLSALTLAAKNGVDVRIITPGIPDKSYVHLTTRSYYRELMRGGVVLYEYTPGFLHSKVIVSDDTVATVGSINLDFRSLYLHFECGAWLLKSKVITDIKEDFLNTLRDCRQITEKDCRVGFIKKLVQNIFRLLAPLM